MKVNGENHKRAMNFFKKKQISMEKKTYKKRLGGFGSHNLIYEFILPNQLNYKQL